MAPHASCSHHQKRTLDGDLARAKDWMKIAVGAIGDPMNDDTKRKVKNVFHIDAGGSDSGRLTDLRARFTKLKASLDEKFPMQCHAEKSAFGAWVIQEDKTGTMHFPLNHFEGSAEDRTERMIHERAHTLFQIRHDGMPPSGALDFGKAQDDDNGFTYEQAIKNAYCYGWLAAALQPGYVSDDGGMIITAPNHLHNR